MGVTTRAPSPKAPSYESCVCGQLKRLPAHDLQPDPWCVPPRRVILLDTLHRFVSI